MLKREDLEGMSPIHGGMSYGRACVEVPIGQEAVLIAAPELALACMEALEFARRVVDHFAGTDAPLGYAAQDIRSLLFNQLSAAGVEVEP